jgi:hypothetical protein
MLEMIIVEAEEGPHVRELGAERRGHKPQRARQARSAAAPGVIVDARSRAHGIATRQRQPVTPGVRARVLQSPKQAEGLGFSSQWLWHFCVETALCKYSTIIAKEGLSFIEILRSRSRRKCMMKFWKRYCIVAGHFIQNRKQDNQPQRFLL